MVARARFLLLALLLAASMLLNSCAYMTVENPQIAVVGKTDGAPE